MERTRDAILRPIHAVGWTRVRRTAYVAYAVVVLYIVIAFGVPTGRITLAILIVSGLLLTSIGHGWRQSLQVLLDWLPFSAVLLLYDRTRGVADTLGISLHEADILHAEKWVFGGVEPTLWLQQHLYDPHRVYWYDVLCTLVYTTHFLMTPVLAAVLWLRNRAMWVRYISRVIVLAVAGLITYCLFPEAPPWLAARDGLTEPVARLSARGWIWLHAGNVNEALAHAQNDGSNPVAAMPSLHTAFATLAAIFIGMQLRTRWRYLLALYPVAMGFTLVYTGEHWVLDLGVGVMYALAVHWLVSRWEGRRAGKVRLRDVDLADVEASAETASTEPANARSTAVVSP
jgi:hypothetical protein